VTRKRSVRPRLDNGDTAVLQRGGGIDRHHDAGVGAVDRLAGGREAASKP